jgi:hypothetical protein
VLANHWTALNCTEHWTLNLEHGNPLDIEHWTAVNTELHWTALTTKHWTLNCTEHWIALNIELRWTLNCTEHWTALNTVRRWTLNCTEHWFVCWAVYSTVTDHSQYRTQGKFDINNVTSLVGNMFERVVCKPATSPSLMLCGRDYYKARKWHQRCIAIRVARAVEELVWAIRFRARASTVWWLQDRIVYPTKYKIDVPFVLCNVITSLTTWH